MGLRTCPLNRFRMFLTVVSFVLLVFPVHDQHGCLFLFFTTYWRHNDSRVLRP